MFLIFCDLFLLNFQLSQLVISKTKLENIRGYFIVGIMKYMANRYITLIVFIVINVNMFLNVMAKD